MLSDKTLSKEIPLSSDILFKLSSELVQLIDEIEICEQVINRLHNSLGYDYVALFLIDKTTKVRNLIASAGFEKPITPLLPGQGLSEKPFIDGKLQYTPDVTKEERYFYRFGGSEVDVPIWVDNKVLGVIVAESKKKNAFMKHDFELLTAVTQITGLAIEKSRIFSNERHRVETLEALGLTMTEITGVRDLNKLLEKIVQRAVALIGATGGELGLIDDENKEINIVVSHNLDKDYVGTKQKIDEGLMGLVSSTRKPEFIENYLEWSEKIDNYESIYSTFGVPLMIGDELLGIFTTVTSDHDKQFDTDDLKILSMFAQQGALAIDSTRLYEKSLQENQERKLLLIEVQKQKEYYETLLVNSPVAIVTADINGIVLSWNPRAELLFGYSIEETVGKPIDGLLGNHPDLRKEAEQYTKEVISAGQVMVTTKRTRKDGSLVDVELLALPIKILNETLGFIAIYVDISELKTIERELRYRNETMAQQLILAGEIQSSFITRNIPELPGWQISANLIPARETSGDFYDIHLLDNGNLAILIADVVGKGVGAALFMSFCWSLFRMFSNEYSDNPSKLFFETNQYILNETEINQFVTAIYANLDPRTGELTISNAGHCPLYHITGNDPKEIIKYPASGLPIGVEKHHRWKNNKIHLQSNDLIVFYTDGIIEAENKRGGFFGEKKLEECVLKYHFDSASDASKMIIQDITEHVEGAANRDDIALITLLKE